MKTNNSVKRRVRQCILHKATDIPGWCHDGCEYRGACFKCGIITCSYRRKTCHECRYSIEKSKTAFEDYRKGIRREIG